MLQPANKFLFAAGFMAVILAGCVTQNQMKPDRSQLIAKLEHEMLVNTNWVRIHAAEGLVENGESEKMAELYRPEADTATGTYRIGVWRVLARSTSGDERNHYIERIRAAMRDPQVIICAHAVEALGKLNLSIREEREFIAGRLATTDEAIAPYMYWLLVLSSNPSERGSNEAAIANFLTVTNPITRLRASYALGKLKDLSADSISKVRAQLKVEPSDSIARAYLIVALLLHSNETSDAAGLEKQLIPYLNGKPNEQLEAATVIGSRGKSEDSALLTPLLNHTEADARIGAAIGLLRLIK